MSEGSIEGVFPRTLSLILASIRGHASLRPPAAAASLDVVTSTWYCTCQTRRPSAQFLARAVSFVLTQRSSLHFCYVSAREQYVLKQAVCSATLTSAERSIAKLQDLTLLFVESTDVRPEAHYDAEAEDEYRLTSLWQFSSTGNSYRRFKTFADGTARQPCSTRCRLRIRSSGRQADPTTTSEGSKSRTQLRDQLRRPYRFQPLSDRV